MTFLDIPRTLNKNEAYNQIFFLFLLPLTTPHLYRDKFSQFELCICFLFAAVTICHKLGGLQQELYYLTVLQVRKFSMSTPVLKSRCWQGCISFWKLQGRIACLAFSSFSRPTTFLVSWFSSSLFTASNVAALCGFFSTQSHFFL